jgi:hypothetical protein
VASCQGYYLDVVGDAARGDALITEMDAKIGQRIVWRSPEIAGEVRYGSITEVNGVEIIIAYDDGAMGLTYIGNELSNVYPA